MANLSAQIKPALLSQSTLINQGEHCSADPDQLKKIDRAKGQQIRVRRSQDEYALYTVSETRQEQPETIVRMGEDARIRLGTADGFAAVVEAQVTHSDLTDTEAEAKSEFVERLTDDGKQTGLIAIAPHGGMIEDWTDRQAERVMSQLAPETVSCWRCKGWKQGGGAFERWHITSTDIHEASFPLLNQIIDRHFAYAVAFHGFNENLILIGGGASKALKHEIRSAIQQAIGNDIPVKIATAADNFNGDNPQNIVNRLAEGHNGIQIEQSAAARDHYWQQIADAIVSVYHCKI